MDSHSMLEVLERLYIFMPLKLFFANLLKEGIKTNYKIPDLIETHNVTFLLTTSPLPLLKIINIEKNEAVLNQLTEMRLD